jgi:hypothetical protein
MGSMSLVTRRELEMSKSANSRRAMYNYATNMRKLSTSRSRFDS